MCLFAVTKQAGAAVSIGAALAVWLAVMVIVTVPAQARGQAQAPAASPGASLGGPSAQPQAGDTVGDETCLTCHEGQKRGYSDGSPHGRMNNPRSPAASGGCESCHGPGKAHVDGGGNKTKIKNPKAMSAREVSDTCTTCHNRTEHMEWDGGKHAARNLSCVTCHSVHDYKYWYEDYAVDDFAFSPATIDRMDLPLALYSGYLYRPYTAHTGWVRLTYLW